jgi:hypothetical protein
MTESNMQQQRDIGGMIVSALLIIVGVVAIWDTTSMLDSDSYVFPRAVAGSMIGLSILFIVKQFVAPSQGRNDEEGSAGGSHIRRACLVVAMVVSALLMPMIGFLISGVLVFIAIMMLAMYDEWTAKLKVVFPLVGVVIVGGFYLMFAELLLVPLPVGAIFE